MMRNTRNKFGMKMNEGELRLYLNKNFMMNEFISVVVKSDAMKKLEVFIYSIYAGVLSSLMEAIFFLTAPVTYDITPYYHFVNHAIKIKFWDINAFDKKIVSALKIEETKLRTINLIIKNKMKEYKIELLAIKQLLFFSLSNWV